MRQTRVTRSDLYERADLTVKQREVVELCDAGHGTHAISKQLGISRTSVRERLEAAEAKIKKLRTAA